MRHVALSLLLCVVAPTLWGQTNRLSVEIKSTRAPFDASELTDQRMREFARNLYDLTERQREARAKATGGRTDLPTTFPARVDILRDGVRLNTARNNQTRANEITLSFATGARSFPPTYQALLQTIFDNAKSTLDLVFGPPAVSGTVEVANYDDDISDRDAVAGGYYLPNNGAGVRQIRFPVFNSPEAAGVNFIHTLLLAYQSDNTYAFDAYQEGLVRAATMRIVRQASAVPNLDQELVQSVLGNSYDVGPHYDWYNQKALGGSRFIAPNLRDVPLPAGGSLGGIYLARYKMAGSAWQKLLAEYPTFIADFNQIVKGNSALINDPAGLITTGQSVLNALRPSDPTIESQSFADWIRGQYILETRDYPGLKLHVETVPITNGLGGTDFGVFLIQATYFETLANRNENLLGGTAYPIFWSNTYDRILPSAQSEKMDIAGAYGSVAPNFSNQNAGNPYLVAIDIPVQDRINRSYVPAGAIASVNNPVANDFYGTVIGVPPATGASLQLSVSIGSEVVSNIPVVNGAFGTRINTANYLGLRTVVVQLQRVIGGIPTTIATRRVNKGPGPLALDFRFNPIETFSFPSGINAGIQLIGIPTEPFSSSLSDVVGIAPNQLLAARYNGNRARYDFFPDTGIVNSGQGYFVRASGNSLPNYTGIGATRQPLSVALRPGWNLISNPLSTSVNLTNIQVIRTTGFPRPYAEAVGEDVGTDVFRFAPGAPDSISGVPEGGAFTATNVLEPGQGYFVRCLSPEGASLLFTAPSVGPSSPQGGSGRAFNSSQGPARRFTLQAVVAPTAFGLRNDRSDVLLQQAPGASNQFSWFEDTPLPPGMGGLQMSIVNGTNLYRDLRGVGPTEYRLRVEGCRRGVLHALELRPLAGGANQITVRDLQTRRTYNFSGRGGRVTFSANRPTSEFIVVISGARG